MRAEPDELKGMTSNFPIDQNEIRPDVTIAEVGPIANHRMIPAASWKFDIRRQHSNDFEQ